MAVDTFGYAIGIGVISLNLFVLNAGRPDIAWRVQIVVSVFLNVVAAANGLVLLVNKSVHTFFKNYFNNFGIFSQKKK
jgi:hypothetical protein